MRYLYHLTEGNRGPVTFEQLQELAKAGTIDNMTPILAEGAREWSRWLFIKDQPQPVAAPAQQPKQTAPAPQTSREAAPAPAPKKAATEAPKATPSAQKEQTAPTPAATPLFTAPQQAQTAAAAAPSAPTEKTHRPFSLKAFAEDLNLLQLIPAGVCAVVTLLSLLSAGIWTFMAHDTRTEYASLRDMAAEHEQKRADLENIIAQQQQVAAEQATLQEEITAMQSTLQLTREESARLAKGPYISEADAKTLKEEQYKANRLKEQEQKH